MRERELQATALTPAKASSEAAWNRCSFGWSRCRALWRSPIGGRLRLAGGIAFDSRARSHPTELFDGRLRWSPGAQGLRKINSPTDRVSPGLVIIDGPEIHADQLPDCLPGQGRGANESLGEGVFQRFARPGKARNGPVEPRSYIFCAEPEVRLLQWFPVGPQLQDPAAVGEQVRVPPGRCRHEHGFAGREVENAGVGSNQNRITELLD